jgi:methyltransferase (TIGR00027 family)
MLPSHSEIRHVSDTALMVAACRALESDGADAYMRDPFAARLAGARGMAILDALPERQMTMLRFGVAVRTRFLDELLAEALASEKIATVVCMGCGLDTRPWRLELPPALRWIEVDFAEMLDYKEGVLAHETPRCRRERIAADLTDAEQRRAVYEAIGAAPALLITEGLLMYLPAATVEALASEPARECGVAHWISDVTTTAFSNAIGDLNQSLRAVRAPDCLTGDQIFDVMRGHGWETAARRSYITDMAFAMPRIRRMLGDRPPDPARPTPPPDDPTGVHRLRRA